MCASKKYQGSYKERKKHVMLRDMNLTDLLRRALARDLGRHVYALDLRNHGDSPHNRRHDYEAMAEDVANFIRDNKLQDSTIIGHSM